jgi:hypothetical protein
MYRMQAVLAWFAEKGLSVDEVRASHVLFHLAELLTDALEPPHLAAGHEVAALLVKRFKAPGVTLVQLETVGVALVDQDPDAETLVVGVNLGVVTKVEQGLGLPQGYLVALPVRDVLQEVGVQDKLMATTCPN